MSNFGEGFLKVVAAAGSLIFGVPIFFSGVALIILSVFFAKVTFVAAMIAFFGSIWLPCVIGLSAMLAGVVIFSLFLTILINEFNLIKVRKGVAQGQEPSLGKKFGTFFVSWLVCLFVSLGLLLVVLGISGLVISIAFPSVPFIANVIAVAFFGINWLPWVVGAAFIAIGLVCVVAPIAVDVLVWVLGRVVQVDVPARPSPQIQLANGSDDVRNLPHLKVAFDNFFNAWSSLTTKTDYENITQRKDEIKTFVQGLHEYVISTEFSGKGNMDDYLNGTSSMVKIKNGMENLVALLGDNVVGALQKFKINLLVGFVNAIARSSKIVSGEIAPLLKSMVEDVIRGVWDKMCAGPGIQKPDAIADIITQIKEKQAVPAPVVAHVEDNVPQ